MKFLVCYLHIIIIFRLTKQSKKMPIPIIPAFNEKVNIAQQIRMMRAKRKMSQDDLANSANISRVQIGKIEKGDANPSIETLTAIAAALHAKINFSLTDNI